MTGAIGGGPILVSGRQAGVPRERVVRRPRAEPRTARSAVGQLPDGRILLVTAEGGSLGYSAGMTNYELAVALARLGAVSAMSLGTGPSAAMAFDGSLLTLPSGGREQPVSDALLLSYTGVYAAPPSTDVLSPNGDGVDDTQTFTYRLVRSATVTATLVGPDRSTRVLVQDGEQPGVHTLEWDGQTAAGAAAAGGNLEAQRRHRRRPRRREHRRPAVRARTTRSARCRRRLPSRSCGRRRAASSRRRSTSRMPRQGDRHRREAERHRDRDGARRPARLRGRRRCSGTAARGPARSPSPARTSCTSSRPTRSAPSR